MAPESSDGNHLPHNQSVFITVVMLGNKSPTVCIATLQMNFLLF